MTYQSWPRDEPSLDAGSLIPLGSVTIHLQLDECVLDRELRCVRRGDDHLQVCPDQLADDLQQ